jgi:hypothetical protein
MEKATACGKKAADSGKPGETGEEAYKYERGILPFEETARVLARSKSSTSSSSKPASQPARISEVLGLQWKLADLPVCQS